MSDRKFTDSEELKSRLIDGLEYAVVQNPSYVFPREEYYPMAPKITGGLGQLVGIVSDMDGTTTTTENLCLHSLETMVRRITGRLSEDEWTGLDHEKDYPHVIGNSTTRHVEYLIRTYKDAIRHKPFVRAALEAAVWTLVNGADEGRRRDVASTLKALGWEDVLAEDPHWQRLQEPFHFDPKSQSGHLDGLTDAYADKLLIPDETAQVRLAIDVYYYRYHEILAQIAAGEGEHLSKELLDGQRLIEPMPGVAIFLALVKGWLGRDAEKAFDYLMSETSLEIDPDEGRRILGDLGGRFQADPAKIAIVTSSIKYEADIVLNEVFAVIREQIEDVPVLKELIESFNSVDEVYDAFITASDSSEIRLKPHRDLYSIALHAMGIAPEDFDKVAGFEDSESGTIAIRAAGIGLCLAVPFSDTAGHDFTAASHVLQGGLPEAILKHGLFL
ncbi:hypothetical protein ACFL4W_00185 [Planctomycetota bacterium]